MIWGARVRRMTLIAIGLLLVLSMATGQPSVAALSDGPAALGEPTRPDEAVAPDEIAAAEEAAGPDDGAAPDEPGQAEVPGAGDEEMDQPPAEERDRPDEAGAGDPGGTAAAGADETDSSRAPVIPDDVRGIYLTAYAAADRAWAMSLIRLIEETELNAIVIDVKNDSGQISLVMPDGTGGIVPDLPDLLERLKRRNIYAIARIVVFKDPVGAARWPERTARTTSGATWRDFSGIAWLDPYNQDNWDYNIEVALQAAALGFDEIQFDYVRFPSDGNVKDIVYPANDGRVREEVIAAFLETATKQLHAVGVPVSADVFGLVTSTEDDMGIGQLLEPLAAATDIISPMVYPSHYGAGNYGLPNPNAAPYETVSRGMQDALRRLGDRGRLQLRPWLQDFSLGHPYGPAEVRAQIRATEELGIRSWLLWNAANVYTRAALGPPAGVEPSPVNPQ